MFSLLEHYGYQRDDVDERVRTIWKDIFEGEHAIYQENGEGLTYVVDTGNNDVRTEGMSYAMMLAVQYDRKDIFDKLWGWVKTYMYMPYGHHAHYFAWSVSPDGVPNAQGPAPDGEEYFAMALFLAGRRWEDEQGSLSYRAQAQEILQYCIHKGEVGWCRDGRESSADSEGEPMWDPTNKLIKFIPEVEWSDPSYHLPHFYDVFAQEAAEEDKAFWKEAARASRAYLTLACDEKTGMSPEYANYDGTPHRSALAEDASTERTVAPVQPQDSGQFVEPPEFFEHGWFYSDSYRTAANIGLDALWMRGEDMRGKSGGDGDKREGHARERDDTKLMVSSILSDRVAALQDFFLTHDRTCAYEVDGTPVDERVLHPVGFIATMAQASLAVWDSKDERQKKNARGWVDMFWNTAPRVGARRYYDNFLYAFALLALSGQYTYEWLDGDACADR